MKTDIHSFIKSCIDREFYLSISVDEYYIPHRKAFHQYHFIHDLMIFGYNLSEKSYRIAGFLEDQMFGESIASFKELEQGYLKNQNSSNVIFLFKKNPGFKYEFNPGYGKVLLTEYLESRDSTESLRMLRNPDENYTFGLNIYEGLKIYLDQLPNQKSPLDIRAFHILWEHKKCMNLRLGFLQDHNYLQTDQSLNQKWTEVQRLAGICRDLALRYSITKNIDILTRISAYLDQIVVRETEAITDLLRIWPE